MTLLETFLFDFQLCQISLLGLTFKLTKHVVALVSDDLQLDLLKLLSKSYLLFYLVQLGLECFDLLLSPLLLILFASGHLFFQLGSHYLSLLMKFRLALIRLFLEVFRIPKCNFIPLSLGHSNTFVVSHLGHKFGNVLWIDIAVTKDTSADT